MEKISSQDSRFFLDMIGYLLNPISISSYNTKPYKKILNDKKSQDYKLFVKIYKDTCHILSDREQIILNDLYGINKEKNSLKNIALKLKLSPERVRQLRNEAEIKIAKSLINSLQDNEK
jgi:DNA-directed RNA polymerase sigma subunit (sigma70/sigma32)